MKGKSKEKLIQRRNEAEERNAAWQRLTPLQQLNELDRKFGIGKGAGKQRKKLQERLRNAKPQV